jgi:hypothetical protein
MHGGKEDARDAAQHTKTTRQRNAHADTHTCVEGVFN